MTQAERAEALGISERQLRRLEAKGCPKDIEGARRWYARNSSDKGSSGYLNDETTRLRSAQADIAELDAAQKRGELVPLEDVKIVVGEMLVNLRRDMEAIPGRTAMQVAVMGDAGEIRELQLHDTRQALGAAADRLQDLFRAFGAGGSTEGTAEQDAGSVG